ncbi:reverse transcriptase domain-containing protein [Tanacetum coccineum]
MTRSSTKEHFTPFEEPERVFHSTRKLFKAPSLDYSSSSEFDLFSDHEDQSEEEVTEAMGEPTMQEYMMKTREDYRSRIARPNGSNNEDANEHIEKVLEIVDLFHIPDEVISFYKGLDVPTRQILDSNGAIPSMKVADAKKAIQDMADHSQKWYNGTTTRARSTDTSDGLATIQAQLNNLGKEIKKVNKKVYVAQIFCKFDDMILYLVQCKSVYRIPVFPPLTGCDRLVSEPRAVRQAYLFDTNTESGPLEDLRETEIPQPLPSAPSLAPPSDDPYLIVRQTHIPTTIDTESEPEDAPSKTGEFEVSKPSDTRITSSHSSALSDFTAPLSPDHPLTQTSPIPTPTRAASLSPSSFPKRYRSSYEIPSPSSSLTLPIRKRYQGTSKLVEDIKDESSDLDTERQGSEDKGPGLEEEEAAPEGRQQVVPAMDTAVDEPLRLGYEALRRRELVVGEGEMPSTFEVGQSSRSRGWQISPSSSAVPTPVALLVTTPATTITVDKDEFLEVGAQLELHGSILHDHTRRLDALPSTLFEGYDRDLRELYTRSGAVRDEIFSQRYRLRSLEREHERATVTFSDIWRSVLALEAWAGQTDAQRAALWHDVYDTQRENHDLRMQIVEERRERLELIDRVARMERRHESRGEQCVANQGDCKATCEVFTNSASTDRTIKRPKGIAENALVGIDKFIFPVDFVVLDMPEDINVPLILGRPFLSTTHAKIDVLKRKITLKVGGDKIVFKSDKPISNIIKRVYALGLRERIELDLDARLMGEALILNRSLDPTYGDYIELNDLNEPLELKRNQVEDLGPTIEDAEVIDEFIKDIVETRNDDNEISNGIDEYPSFCDVDRKIHIDCAYNLQFSCMIVVENMDAYRDEGMGDVIVRRPFCREICVKASGSMELLPFTMKRLSLKISTRDQLNGILHPYQKLKGFYKGVLNLGPEYIRDAKMEEWLTGGHVSIHEMK